MENTEFDKISYALGMSMGNNFKASGINEIDVTDFADGVAAVFSGAKAKMTYDEAKEVIRQYFTEMEARQQAEAAKLGEINAKAGKEFLAENGKRAEVKTTATGLQYEVIKEGDGAQPAATDQVEVHYTGKLIDGTVFDQLLPENDKKFPISGFVAGFTEGLLLMDKGSSYIFYIPGDLAYGVDGLKQAGIGPNETLVFEVELLDIYE